MKREWQIPRRIRREVLICSWNFLKQTFEYCSRNQADWPRLRFDWCMLIFCCRFLIISALRILTWGLLNLWHFQNSFDLLKGDAAITGQNKVSYCCWLFEEVMMLPWLLSVSFNRMRWRLTSQEGQKCVNTFCPRLMQLRSMSGWTI